MYGIYDWANNRLFPDKKFRTFETGWDYIMEQFPNEEDLGDYQVLKIKDMEG